MRFLYFLVLLPAISAVWKDRLYERDHSKGMTASMVSADEVKCSQVQRGFQEGTQGGSNCVSGTVLNAEVLESVETFSPMPVLNPPPETAVRRDHSSIENRLGSDEKDFIISENIVATLGSEMGIDFLAQHYEVQWEEAGWTPLSNEDSLIDNDNSAQGTVLRFWMFEDEAEQSWLGILMIRPDVSNRLTMRRVSAEHQVDRYIASASVVLQENNSAF